MTQKSRFEYSPSVLRHGSGSIHELGDELERHDLHNVYVVTGETVGDTPEIMTQVKNSLGEKLKGVFAGTTPEKRLDTAYKAVGQKPESIDVVVGVGGGSSLDLAKVVSVLAATRLGREEVWTRFRETKSIPVPPDVYPVVAVPTTLAGADHSNVAGVKAYPDSGFVDEVISGGIQDPDLMPKAVFYDPDLIATTPNNILKKSAMNGFNKGLESLYSPQATPVTIATAIRGIKLFRQGLLRWSKRENRTQARETFLDGLLLVMYGVYRPDGTTLSIQHAFGHALRDAGVHQGTAHAITTPYVLEYVYSNVEVGRDLIAQALGVDESKEAIVTEITDMIESLGLPTSIREVDGPSKKDLRNVANAVMQDPLMHNVPLGLDPDTHEIESVLRDAW